MARNEEKQYGRLNRLLLQKEKEEYLKEHPKRPKLENMYTAEEIKQWIPSIKHDIDFYLKKSQVVCYSDDQVTEARVKVSKLEKEFKAFLRKLRQLDPRTTDIPWTSRPYKSKVEVVKHNTVDKSKFIPLPTPVLNTDEPEENTSSVLINISSPMMDLPLTFNSSLEESSNSGKRKVDTNEKQHENCVCDLCPPTKQLKTFDNCHCQQVTELSVKNRESLLSPSETCGMNSLKETDFGTANVNYNSKLCSNQLFQGKNILGLDYESSSEEEGL